MNESLGEQAPFVTRVRFLEKKRHSSYDLTQVLTQASVLSPDLLLQRKTAEMIIAVTAMCICETLVPKMDILHNIISEH